MNGSLESRYNQFRAKRDWEKRNDIARIARSRGRNAEASEKLPVGDIPVVLNFTVTGAGKIIHTTDQAIQYLNDYEQVSLKMWETMWQSSIIKHCKNAYSRKREASMRASSQSRTITTCCIYREHDTFEESVFVINIVILNALRNVLAASETVFTHGNSRVQWEMVGSEQYGENIIELEAGR
tara:strand:- start:466 stop:1011 length:546 start_codon:yes stop_codon:yes gene_type:complete